MNIVKKASDAERKKSEEKKIKKKNKPKGYGAKRFGMITFWLLFSFMFLVTTITVFGNSQDSSLENTNVEENKLFNHEGLEFAKDFVYEYFTWTTDKHGKERRIANLEHFFLQGIDELGGVVFDNQWSSSIDKRNIILKDIQKINDEQARFIFKVTFTLRSPTDEPNTQIDVDNLDFNELAQEERKVRVINGFKTKVSEKYINVPVYYNAETNQFAVFDLPSFTYINEERMDELLENDFTKLEILSDGYTENNVVAFLNTFFESYSTDSRDKLNYILEDERHQNGLNGTMHFSEISDVRIFKADDNNNRFIAEAEVKMIDPSTKFEFMNKYLLVIKRKEQRYIVESLNDERFVNDLVKNYLADRGDEKITEFDNLTNEDEEIIDFDYQIERNEIENEEITGE